LSQLRKQGAAGDLCLQFFDCEGAPVHTELSERVIGMSLQQIKKAKRVVALAGGKRKVEAIRGALRGQWIDVLITDSWTAKAIVNRA
jgi:DNA-binding transcriptional regulator LsrR (DeoR family)